jgi:hypothetical protein
MGDPVRGFFGALLFGRELLAGKSPVDAKEATRVAMGELAPLVDPALYALADIQRKRAAAREALEKKKASGGIDAKEAAPARPGDDATVIDTTGTEEVIDAAGARASVPKSKARRAAAGGPSTGLQKRRR